MWLLPAAGGKVSAVVAVVVARRCRAAAVCRAVWGRSNPARAARAQSSSSEKIYFFRAHINTHTHTQGTCVSRAGACGFNLDKGIGLSSPVIYMADGFPYLALVRRQNAHHTLYGSHTNTPDIHTHIPYIHYTHIQHTHNSPNGRLFHRLRTAMATPPSPEGRRSYTYTKVYW